MSQFGGGSNKTLSGEGGEVVLNGEGRCDQPRSYLSDGGAEEPGHQVKVIGQKVVGVLDFDSVWRDRSVWKVPQVAGDYHVTATDYCRGENMTVVGVRKNERGS